MLENSSITFPAAHGFTHEAMHTTFHLRICHPEAALARDMARECFDHLDFLESRLSRFIDDSDISRINHLKAGETLFLSEPVHQCLLLALDAHARTGGLFDISLGRPIRHLKSSEALPDEAALCGVLSIHPDAPAVTCVSPGRELDLGGIGKGFALDQLCGILQDWGAQGGLLAAGASSLLAFGPDAWPVDLAGDVESLRIALRDEALSASGTGIQGAHLVHPAGQAAMPSAPCRRIWACATSAAEAEIWSTALMLIEPEMILDFTAGEAALRAIHSERAGRIEAHFAAKPSP
jgi:thiamine biosynthesis lipoprotein